MKTKHKVAIAALPLLIVMGVSAYVGVRTLQPGLADTSTANAQCAGNSLSVHATAPGSVTKGSSFTISNVSSTSTAPGGITVNKVVSTSSITNGTPSSVIGTWTGTGTGTFTASFPDLSLTASGVVGSQVKLNLTSIDIYINGLTTPITCSVAGGNLTGSGGAGQPITLVSTTITDTQNSSPPSGNNTTPGNTSTGNQKSTSPSSSRSTASQSNNPSANNSTTEATPAQTAPVTTGKTVVVTVTDKPAHPLAHVKVAVDNLPAIYTSNEGTASFTNVAVGSHKVSVWSGRTPIVRSFSLSSDTPSTYALSVQIPKHGFPILLIAAILACLLLVVGIVLFLLRRRTKQQLVPSPTPTPPELATAPTITPTLPTPPDDSSHTTPQF